MIVFFFLHRGAVLQPGPCGGPWLQDTGPDCLLIRSLCGLGVNRLCGFTLRLPRSSGGIIQAVIIKLMVMESHATGGLTAKSVRFTTEIFFNVLNEHTVKL